MPRAEERFLTASSKDFGKRILSCAVFFSNSNLTGVRPERSYSERSAVSTKCSASASVLKVGIFFFIASDLFPVHVTGGNRANQALPISLPDSEDQKHGSAARRLADRPKASLVSRMRLVRDDQQRAIEKRFDLGGRHAVPLALCAIAIVPVEIRRGLIHSSLYIHMYIQITFNSQSTRPPVARPGRVGAAPSGLLEAPIGVVPEQFLPARRGDARPVHDLVD